MCSLYYGYIIRSRQLKSVFQETYHCIICLSNRQHLHYWHLQFLNDMIHICLCSSSCECSSNNSIKTLQQIGFLAQSTLKS